MPQQTKKDNTYSKGRLVYIDPNQYTQVNGTDMSPNYEDMCITVDLIVEVADRFNSYRSQWSADGKDEQGLSKKFVISSSTRMADTPHNISAYEGGKYGNNIYLDTFYTDISFDSYGKETKIQGLGIASIDIAFESFIAPTVAMKLIDTRGSAIWGREEAIHGKNTISADNIFGCFFTFPYPKFTLMVKGFYGKPVSLQLICSSFKGSFNAQTGNFEADVQFIGLRYSFLSDIPFAYLVAAPHCPYKGHDYFEEHRYDAEWLLTCQGGTTHNMISLRDYTNTIRELRHPRQHFSYKMDTAILELDTLEQCRQRKQRLEEIIKKFNELFGTSKSDNTSLFYKEGIRLLFVDNSGIDSTEENGEQYQTALQLYDGIMILPFHYTDNCTSNCATRVFRENSTSPIQNLVGISEATINKINEIIDAINEYNTFCAPLNQGINLGTISEKITETKTTTNKNAFGDFIYQITNVKLSQFCLFTHPISKTKKEEIDETIDSLGITEETKTDFRTKFVDILNKTNPPSDLTLGYLAFIHLGNSNSNIISATYQEINTVSNEITRINNENDQKQVEEQRKADEAKRLDEEAKKKRENQIAAALSVTPYIGNIVQIILAHLETFMYMLYSCAADIEAEQRTGQKLNLKYELTDIPLSEKNSAIPPFPAVYTTGDANSTRHEWDWIGNISPNFQEEKLVLGLLESILGVMENTLDETSIKTPSFNPILPNDAVNRSSPFSNVKIENLDDLAGYAVMRAFYILGIFMASQTELNDVNIEILEMLARFDGYNCLYSNPKTITKEDFEKKFNDNTPESVLIDIALCKDSANQWAGEDTANGHKFSFERCNSRYVQQERHPIMRENGDYYEYIYTARPLMDNNTPKGDISIIPSRLRSWTDIVGNKPTFGPVTIMKSDGKTDTPLIVENYNRNKASNFCVKNSDSDYISSDCEINKELCLKNYYNNSMFDIIEAEGIVTIVRQLIKRYQGKDGKLTVRVPTTSDIDESDAIELIRHIWVFTEDGLNGNSIWDDVFCNTISIKKDDKDERIKLNDYYELYDKEADEQKFRSDVNIFSSDYSTAYTLDAVGLNEDDEFVRKTGEGIDNDEKFASNDVFCNTSIWLTSQTKHLLFFDGFYYEQNKILKNEAFDEKTRRDLCNKNKAFIFLNCRIRSIGCNLSCMTLSKKIGSIEIVPHMYALFLGALLWRYRICEENGWDDVLIWGDYDKPSGKAYAYSLLKKTPTGDILIGKCDCNVTDKSREYITISECIDSLGRSYNADSLTAFAPDWHIQNKFIALFENFATHGFSEAIRTVELVNYIELDGSNDNDKKKTYEVLYGQEDLYNKIIVPLSKNLNKQESNEQNNEKNFEYIEKHIRTLNHGSIFNSYYNLIYVDESDTINGCHKTDAIFPQTSKNWLLKKVVIVDSLGKYLPPTTTVSDSQLISVPKKLIETYVSKFVAVIKEYMGEGTSVSSEDGSLLSAREGLTNDICSRIGIYIYLKNFWDNWANNMNFEQFTVKEVFPKFLFMNEYYHNIKYDLLVNATKFLDEYDYAVLHGSLCHILDHVGLNTGSAFLTAPMFSGLYSENFNDGIATLKDRLSDAFLPIPYNQTAPPEQDNYFIYMYNGNKSTNVKNNQDFTYDSFDLFDDKDGEIVCMAPPIVTGFGTDDYGQSVGLDGFNIPSFGVAFGKQEQAHFKNIKLNTDNPIITTHTADIVQHLAALGKSDGTRMIFVGQDIYSVHSSYSYKIEVESMGNMQIQQLMYFQLLNIPMFRGTYMVQKVTHSIKPGDMTTKFTGYKISKWMLPWNTEFAIQLPPRPSEDDEDCVQYVEGNISDGGKNVDYDGNGTLSREGTIALIGDSWLTYLAKDGYADGFEKVLREKGMNNPFKWCGVGSMGYMNMNNGGTDEYPNSVFVNGQKPTDGTLKMKERVIRFLKDTQPKILVMELGVNDCDVDGTLYNKPTEITRFKEKILDPIVSGVQLVVMTPFNLPTTKRNLTPSSCIKNFAKEVREYCQKKGIVCLDMNGGPHADEFIDKTSDGIHLQSKYFKVAAGYVAEEFVKKVK